MAMLKDISEIFHTIARLLKRNTSKFPMDQVTPISPEYRSRVEPGVHH